MEGSQQDWKYDRTMRSRLARLLKETAIQFFEIETGFDPGISVEDNPDRVTIQVRMASSGDPCGAEITVTAVEDGS